MVSNLFLKGAHKISFLVSNGTFNVILHVSAINSKHRLWQRILYVDGILKLENNSSETGNNFPSNFPQHQTFITLSSCQVVFSDNL